MKKALEFILFLLCIVYEHSCRAAKYVGCLEHSEDIQRATGFVQEFAGSLTHEECNRLCFESGYSYAATRNGNSCLCVNYDDSKSKPKWVEESRCDKTCNGNPLQKCGGEFVITVYQTITFNALAVGKSLGCYDDSREQRILNQSRFQFNKTNSPQKCLNACRELKFKFSGVKNSRECHCGDTFNVPLEEDSVNLELDDTECHMPCSGDPIQNCGQQSNIHIYRTGEPDKIPPAGLAGCFSVKSGFVSEYMENTGNFTTPIKCMIKCYQFGFKYAGIQLGIECHCRNSAQGLQLVDKSKCNLNCSGESFSSVENGCGGVNTISGYDLKIPSHTGQRVGCFKDGQTYPILDGYKADLIATNSADRCLNICFQLGFIYAGVRNGYKCLCGSSAPANPQLVSDVECNMNCPRDKKQKCGGNERLIIYNTGFKSAIDGAADTCVKSVTTVNGVHVCKDAVIFRDTFTQASSLKSKWKPTVRFSGDEEYEFVTYTADSAHVNISDSRLKIKPTLLPDDIVRSGEWKLEGCTGEVDTYQCEQKAIAYNIMPPIQSASVNTKDSFTFQYGIVNVRAKVPVGDWIVPQFYLRAKDESYGPGYKSGIIRIGTVKGNKDLVCGNQTYGLKHVEHGVILSNGYSVKGRTIKRTSDKTWNSKFHNYTVYWGPDKISFFVDEIQEIELFPGPKSTLREVVGFTPEESEIWKKGSKIAPFDKEFYLSIGVSVGGMREFDDDCVSNGQPKPWGNGKVKSMLNFWQDYLSWHQTWGDNTILKVESVVITAL